MSGLGESSRFDPTPGAVGAHKMEAKRRSISYIGKKTLLLQLESAKQLTVTIFSLNGKKALSRKYLPHSANCKVEIALTSVRSGVYLFSAEHNGLTITDYIPIR